MNVNPHVCPQGFSLAPQLCGATSRLTEELLLFQCFLQVRQNQAQTARLLQKVQSDKAAPGEDCARQQRVSSDLNGWNKKGETKWKCGLMFVLFVFCLKGNEILAQAVCWWDHLKKKKERQMKDDVTGYYSRMEDATRRLNSAPSGKRKSRPLGGRIHLCSCQDNCFVLTQRCPALPIIYSRLNSPSWCCGIWFSCPSGTHTQRPPRDRWSPEDIHCWTLNLSFFFSIIYDSWKYLINPIFEGIFFCICVFIH